MYYTGAVCASVANCNRGVEQVASTSMKIVVKIKVASAAWWLNAQAPAPSSLLT